MVPAGFISTEENETLLNYFFSAQFNFCPLKMVTVMSLSIFMKDAFCSFIFKKLSYEESLSKDGLVSVYHKNIQTLRIEMYKVQNELP